MKKLRLKALSLGAKEILSRQQLKEINGGCTSDADCNGGTCNSFSECVGGGSGDDPGSGSGPEIYDNGCPLGELNCYCNGTYKGCLDWNGCQVACGLH